MEVSKLNTDLNLDFLNLCKEKGKVMVFQSSTLVTVLHHCTIKAPRSFVGKFFRAEEFSLNYNGTSQELMHRIDESTSYERYRIRTCDKEWTYVDVEFSQGKRFRSLKEANEYAASKKAQYFGHGQQPMSDLDALAALKAEMA